MSDEEQNKIRIDKVMDSPQAGHGASYTKQNEIKSQRLDVISTADDNLNITEPSSPSHGEYIYNRAEQTQSGHLREMDDTPGAERIMEMHKSGTFYEIHPDGTRVLRVYGDNFEIALSDNNLVVGGNLNITVQGDANILTKGNVKQKIGGNYDLTVHGNMTTRVEGTRLDYTTANLYMRSEGSTTCFAEGKYHISTNSTAVIKSAGYAQVASDSRIYLDASRIDFDLPGPSASIIDPTDKDPTGGLTIEDSVVQPSFENLNITKTANPYLSNLTDNDITYPKDRTPFT